MKGDKTYCIEHVCLLGRISGYGEHCGSVYQGTANSLLGSSSYHSSSYVTHSLAMDRQNNPRWLPIYLANMNSLATEFMSGYHAVSRSSHPFLQVWTDLALGQSIIADSKGKGGIVGISQTPTALNRWFRTARERASMTSALK